MVTLGVIAALAENHNELSTRCQQQMDGLQGSLREMEEKRKKRERERERERERGRERGREGERELFPTVQLKLSSYTFHTFNKHTSQEVRSSKSKG